MVRNETICMHIQNMWSDNRERAKCLLKFIYASFERDRVSISKDILQIIIFYLTAQGPSSRELLELISNRFALWDAPEVALELLNDVETCIGENCLRNMCYGCRPGAYEP